MKRRQNRQILLTKLWSERKQYSAAISQRKVAMQSLSMEIRILQEGLDQHAKSQLEKNSWWRRVTLKSESNENKQQEQWLDFERDLKQDEKAEKEGSLLKQEQEYQQLVGKHKRVIDKIEVERQKQEKEDKK